MTAEARIGFEENERADGVTRAKEEVEDGVKLDFTFFFGDGMITPLTISSRCGCSLPFDE